MALHTLTDLGAPARSRRDPSKPFEPGWRGTPGRVPPLAPVAVAMASGIILDRFGEWCGTATWAAVALLASVVAMVGLRRRGVCYPALVVGFAALGGAWHHWRWSDLAADDLARVVTEEPRPSWVRGIVLTVPEHRVSPIAEERPGDDGYTRFELQITSSSDGQDWHDASGRALVTVGGKDDRFGMGDAIEAAGSLALLPGPLNPGETDPRLAPRARGIRLGLSVEGPDGARLDPDGTSSLRLRWLGWVRSTSEARLSELLSDRTAAVAAALLLGRRGGIDGETSAAFSRTGTAHLLAISGLHLSAVAGVVGLLAVLLGFNHKDAATIVLTATMGYATLVGWTPSVSRAAAMVGAVCVAAIVDRSSKPANTITLAILFTMIVNPTSLFRIGWQLSFLAIAALILGVPPLMREIERRMINLDPNENPLDVLERKLEPAWKRIGRRIALAPVLALMASAAVWLVTMPLIAWQFNVVAPIGILLNLPMIPMVSAAVILGGLALMASAVWQPLAMPAAWLCDRLLGVSLTIVDRAESLSLGHAFVPTPPTVWVVAGYAMLAVAWRGSAARWPRPIRRATWGGVVLVGLFGAGATITPQRPSSYEVEFLAVGHGLTTLIRGPDGSASLYDCGRSGDPSVGRRIAAPALWARGVRRIDRLVISHADADHYNGVSDLIDRFAIGALLIPEGFGEQNNPGARSVLELARARSIAIHTVASGDRFELVPGLVAEVLHPARDWLPDANDNDRSLVLDLTIGSDHVLLTGDLDGAGLAELLAMPRRPVTVMLAPHHGGRSANPPWLYDWAEPARVVTSQRAPRPGASDALEGLSDRGISVHRTWQEGAIHISWDAGSNSQGPKLTGWRSTDGSAFPDLGSPWDRGKIVSASITPGWSSLVVRGVIGIGGLMLGLWLCGATAVIHWGAWSLVLPGRGSVQEASFPEPWRSVSIVARDGVRLRGWRREPEGPLGPCHIALIVHGLAEASPSMQTRAEALVRGGWTVLVLDLRTFGQSEGDRASFGAREAEDLKGWIDLMRSDAPEAPIVAWGRSMGAAVALRTATEDDRIAAVVMEAPYADLREALAARLRRLRFPGAARLCGFVLWQAARIVGDRLDRPRPIDLVPHFQRPVLILLGEADSVTPVPTIERLVNAFPNAHRPEVIRIAEAEHGEVFDRGGPPLIDQLLGFLDRATERPDPFQTDQQSVSSREERSDRI
ncbi:ComEC/Rec2 family competence protein [Tautonia rosea]|uniref:ComEC/Rec2 family competence protein n=1 Tax=Tautonia rosea TaxID=2728037 RepID=UPI0014750756|nr:ComEC/Rec2 family competence protein [Tautonia rosea]